MHQDIDYFPLLSSYTLVIQPDAIFVYTILDRLKCEARNKVKYFNLNKVPVEVLDAILAEANISSFYH